MLVSLGLDHRSAGLEIRERFHLPDPEVPRVYEALARSGIREAVLARTCNRLEATCWWPEAEIGDGGLEAGRAICRAWVGDDGAAAELLLAHSRVRISTDVVRHLLRVSAGLESQILGDIHILGQIRRAFRDAVAIGSVGSHLHRLFETSLRVGKQVKRETHLMATRSGVGSEAARRAIERPEDAGREGLANRLYVVVGSGKIGSQAAHSLASLGAKRITIVNRTLHRARTLADELGATAEAAGLDALPDLLARAAVVIVATDAPDPVLTAASLRRARTEIACESSQSAQPAKAPLLVIDVSVPRNVEPAVAGLGGVELIDLDTLHPEAADVEKSRNAAVPEAEARVEAGVEDFLGWLDLDEARQALRPLHEVLSEICRREVAYVVGASALSDRTAERIVARVLAHPMTRLRAASERGESMQSAAGALGVLFAQRGCA